MGLLNKNRIKIFNLAVILAVLASAVTFSSCSKNEDATVTISLDKTALLVDEALTGKITSDDALKQVTLLKDGQTVSGFPLTSFGATDPISGKDGSYTIRIEGLGAGSYTIRATDKNGKEDSKTFTVSATPVLDWSKATNTITANGNYAYQQGNYTGYLTVSSLTTTSVNIIPDAKAQVTLADNGTSYLLKTGVAANYATTTSTILLAKKTNEAKLVDCTGVASADLQAGTPVKFLKIN